MKRIIISMLISFSIISCTKNTSNEIATPQEVQTELSSYQDLIIELETYNSELGIETRAGGFWRRLGRVALADCTGYIFGSYLGPGGGFLFGIFSSVIAVVIEVTTYHTRSGYLNVDLSHDRLYEPIGLTNLEACDYVGNIHNQVIEEIYAENPDCFETFTEQQWINAISQKISMMFLMSEVTDITPNINEAHEINDIIMAPENDLDAAFEEIKVKMPDRTNELEVVLIYCKSLNSIDDNEGVINYTQGFRDIVVNSNIDEDSKQFVQSAISVAGNSQLLWSECIE